jgi:hypothetical protein
MDGFKQGMRDKLTDKIRRAVGGLSDEQAVELGAGNIGLALFPDTDTVQVHGDFTDARWYNSASRQWSWQQYGEGIRVDIGFDCDLDDLALEPDSDATGTLLEEKMADPQWLASWANKCRNRALADLESEIDALCDSWSSILEEQEVAANETGNE